MPTISIIHQASSRLSSSSLSLSSVFAKSLAALTCRLWHSFPATFLALISVAVISSVEENIQFKELILKFQNLSGFILKFQV